MSFEAVGQIKIKLLAGQIVKRLKSQSAGPVGMIGEAAWSCADPGLQYDTTVNDWHTCLNTNDLRIEPVFRIHVLDNTACNPPRLT